jgi:hypothetical protein
MTDTAVTETHTNKRKASVAGDGEQEADASPKRVRLESPAASNTNGTEDGPIPAPQREPEQQADATHIKPAIAQDSQEPSRNPAQRDPSPPPPRRSSPEPSRSPVASRRPSVPTTEARQAPGSGPDRGRRSISEQEKKRGQRLFGGLLSTLSQKPGGGGGGAGGQQQQKRRAEIERRQQERAQQQRAEDDKRRVQKLAKLNRLREIEQVKLEEDVVSPCAPRPPPLPKGLVLGWGSWANNGVRCGHGTRVCSRRRAVYRQKPNLNLCVLPCFMAPFRKKALRAVTDTGVVLSPLEAHKGSSGTA